MFTIIYSKSLSPTLSVNGRKYAAASELADFLTAFHEDGFNTTIESGIVKGDD